MIKSLNEKTALKYARSLNLGQNEYVIFDLGKNIMMVGGSKDVFTQMAEEAALSFSMHLSRLIFDEYENMDDKRLHEKLKLSEDYIRNASEMLMGLLEKENIKTAVI